MTYMLSESAARKLRALLRDPSALIPSQIGQTRRVRPDAGGGIVAGNRFHFDVTVGSDGVTVGEGVVQIGGYTYASAEQTLDPATTTTALLCVRVDLQSGGCTCLWFADMTALRAAQDDMRYYIFPLYKFSGGAKSIDYRPLPQAGCWESNV